MCILMNGACSIKMYRSIYRIFFNLVKEFFLGLKFEPAIKDRAIM
jgi:hypothetical protein